MTPPSTSTRRRFLTRSMQTLCGVSLFRALDSSIALPAEPTVAPDAKIRFGFTTFQWGKDWDIPTLLSNLQKARVLGVELRTSQSYAHGVELALNEPQRREVRNRFADSPVTLVGIASGEKFDWPEPAKLKEAVQNAKGYVKLSHDVGGSGVRVFPNQFHPAVPRERTIEQIARALNEVGAVAADYGQEVRLEAHGAAGALPTIRAIMDRVTQRTVRVKLNSDARDTQAPGFAHNFNLVKNLLGHTLHLHNLQDPKFPYQLQTDLLVRMNWEGWALLEASDKVPDRLQALIEQRQIWDQMLDKARQAQGANSGFHFRAGPLRSVQMDCPNRTGQSEVAKFELNRKRP